MNALEQSIREANRALDRQLAALDRAMKALERLESLQSDRQRMEDDFLLRYGRKAY